jgi:hypothetical protein
MSASRLKTLRVRVDHLVLGVGSVMVLVVALLTWRSLQPDPDEQAEVEQGLERVRAKQSSAPTRTPRFARGFYSGAPQEDRGEGTAVFEPPPQKDPGDVGPAEAVESFEQVIGELEDALENKHRLSKNEAAEYYNRATGSFTVLSAWVDPSNPSERAMLDDAYAQMTALMRELDIRPPKRETDFYLRER